MAVVSSRLAQQPRRPCLGHCPAPYRPCRGRASGHRKRRITLNSWATHRCPSVGEWTWHDDNIYPAQPQTADQMLVLTPALRPKRHGPTSSPAGATMGQYRQQHGGQLHPYLNLNGMADFDLGTRLRANLSGDYLDGEDPRGSTNNAISSTSDRYRQTQGRGIFSYGARGAQGRIGRHVEQLAHRRDIGGQVFHLPQVAFT
jgi:hypothetical protein